MINGETILRILQYVNIVSIVFFIAIYLPIGYTTDVINSGLAKTLYSLQYNPIVRIFYTIVFIGNMINLLGDDVV